MSDLQRLAERIIEFFNGRQEEVVFTCALIAAAIEKLKEETK